MSRASSTPSVPGAGTARCSRHFCASIRTCTGRYLTDLMRWRTRGSQAASGLDDEVVGGGVRGQTPSSATSSSSILRVATYPCQRATEWDDDRVIELSVPSEQHPERRRLPRRSWSVKEEFAITAFIDVRSSCWGTGGRGRPRPTTVRSSRALASRSRPRALVIAHDRGRADLASFATRFIRGHHRSTTYNVSFTTTVPATVAAASWLPDRQLESPSRSASRGEPAPVLGLAAGHTCSGSL